MSESPSSCSDFCPLYPAWGPSFSILSFAALSASSPAVAARGFTDAKVGWPRWIRRFEVHSLQILPSAKRNWPGKPPYDSSFGQPETASVKIPKRFRQETNRTKGKRKTEIKTQRHGENQTGRLQRVRIRVYHARTPRHILHLKG
nr:MAG TPA: hypothetical protein [Caudoviricetes sp.]